MTIVAYANRMWAEGPQHAMKPPGYKHALKHTGYTRSHAVTEAWTSKARVTTDERVCPVCSLDLYLRALLR